MKKGDINILAQIKKITVVLGILVGFYAMNLSHLVPATQEQTIEENADGENTSSDYVIKSIDAVSYSSQINVSHEAILIEELPETEVDEASGLRESKVITYTSKAFKVLFRRIISPNAP